MSTVMVAAWREKVLALNQEDLDDEVHDSKGNEAADINNAGRVSQVAYLLGIEDDEAQALIDANEAV